MSGAARDRRRAAPSGRRPVVERERVGRAPRRRHRPAPRRARPDALAEPASASPSEPVGSACEQPRVGSAERAGGQRVGAAPLRLRPRARAHARAVGRYRDREASPDRRARHAQPAHAAAGSGAADRRCAHAGVAADHELQRADHHEHRMARVVRQGAGEPDRAGRRRERGGPGGARDRHAGCGRHVGHHGAIDPAIRAKLDRVPRAPERVREGGGRRAATTASAAQRRRRPRPAAPRRPAPRRGVRQRPRQCGAQHAPATARRRTVAEPRRPPAARRQPTATAAHLGHEHADRRRLDQSAKPQTSAPSAAAPASRHGTASRPTRCATSKRSRRS